MLKIRRFTLAFGICLASMLWLLGLLGAQSLSAAKVEKSSQALPVTTLPSCGQPFVFNAGIEDDFDPTIASELTQLSPEFEAYITQTTSLPLRQFDNITSSNQIFVHSFPNLTSRFPEQPICAATLKIHLKAGFEGTTDDTLWLVSVDDEQLSAWLAYLGSGNSSPELLPYNWEPGISATISLNLDQLPLAGGHLTTTLPQLNQDDFLNVLVTDNTGVDYISLTVWYEREDSAGNLIEVGEGGFAAARQLVALGEARVLSETISTITPTLTLEECVSAPFLGAEQQQCLYHITSAHSVSEVLASIPPSTAYTFEPNYIIHANPNDVVGSPGEAPGITVTAGTSLNEQWAIEAIGGLAAGLPTGEGIEVAIFDASCFTLPRDTYQPVSFMDTSMTVLHPFTTTYASLPYTSTIHANLCGHGEYVASLVHTVAPSATLSLYRVLDDTGRGDLFTLRKMLNSFINDTLATRGTLNQTVINLSLGVAGSLTDPTLDSIQTLLHTAHNQGAVIVAAAGNGSDDQDIWPSQLPAAYDFVIGAAASGRDGARASYSNPGQVAAPGGFGHCHDVNMATDCLVGVDQTSTTGYRAWAGTSFATPLVSGLAALLLEESPMSPPNEIADRIYTATSPSSSQDPNLGAGIINVLCALTLPSCNSAATEAVVLSLEPATLTTGVNETFELPIVVQAGTQEVDGAAAHLNFDPAYFQVDSITPGSEFSTVILNQFDNDSGQLDFAAGSFDNFPSGTFSLATVTFSTTALTDEDGTVVGFNSTMPRSSDVTFNGASVLSYTEESTIFIQNATLTGAVTLQGRPTPPHPRWSVPLRVSFTVLGEDEPAYTFEPTTDENGHFSLSGIAPGTYEVRVKHSHTLQNKQTVTVVNGDNGLIDFGTLREGDANDDNYVTILDFSILAATFAKCEGTTGYDARADFNNDTCVTILDFSLLASNFAQGGDHSAEGRAAEADAPTGNASLIIDQPMIQARAGDTYLVTVRLEADSAVDGAAAYIDFDQSLLKVNSIRSGEAFDLELQQQFDNQTGSINFAAGTLTSPPLLGGEGLGVRGDFLVIELEAIGDGESPLTFQFDMPRSTDVTAGGQSVLNHVSDGSNSTTTAVEVAHLAANGTAPLAWAALVLISLLVMGVVTLRWLVGLRIAIK